MLVFLKTTNDTNCTNPFGLKLPRKALVFIRAIRGKNITSH